jgi:YVTN family beta-propeller protein
MPILRLRTGLPRAAAPISRILLVLSLFACDGSKDEAKPQGQVIYSSVSSSNEVLAIDDASHAIRKHFGVGKGPAILVGTPGLEKLYTANWADNTVSAIDVVTGNVKSIALPGKPYVVAIDATGKRVYAGLASSAIAVIDTGTDAVLRQYPTTELPASLIVSPDGKTLYVATLNLLGLDNGSLFAMSAETGDITREAITVGRVPAWIAITPDGSKVYTLNFLSDDISVIDTESWTLATTIATGSGSMGIIGSVSPDGKRLYVTNHGDSTLIAIDTGTNTVVQKVPLNGRPVGVQLSPDGKRVYVTDFGPQSKNEPPQVNYLLTGNFNATGPGQVSAYDTETGKLVGSVVSVAAGPTSVLVGPTAD